MTPDDIASGVFEPVEGVSLERYAALAVRLHGTRAEDHDRIAAEHGVAAGRLQAVAQGWNQRLAQHPEVARRYSDLYQQAMKDAGIEAPEITLEQYAEILRRAKTEPLDGVLGGFGLNLQTFALVSGRWAERLQADPSLGLELARLLGATPG